MPSRGFYVVAQADGDAQPCPVAHLFDRDLAEQLVTSLREVSTGNATELRVEQCGPLTPWMLWDSDIQVARDEFIFHRDEWVTQTGADVPESIELDMVWQYLSPVAKLVAAARQTCPSARSDSGGRREALAAGEPDSIDRQAELAGKVVDAGPGSGDNGDAKLAALSVRTTADATPTDPTAGDLASEVGVSNDTFGRVRDAAGIEVEGKGGAARNRRYTQSEVDRLIAAALAGNFLERIAMSKKWAKWGSKQAADKPQPGN